MVRGANLHMEGPEMHHSGSIFCVVANLMAAALTLQPRSGDQAGSGCPGVGLASQQKGYITHAYTSCNANTFSTAIRGPSCSPVPRYCPWITSHLVAPGQNFEASKWLFNIQ